MAFTDDNQVEIIKGIDNTVLYDKEGNVLKQIDNSYLDVGINDTMKDLIVNLIGALVFSFISYLYLTKSKHEKIINSLIVKKGTDKVISMINLKLKEENDEL